MTEAEYQAFLSAWENYPCQDNEGYQPDRGSFKSGFFAGVKYMKAENTRLQKEGQMILSDRLRPDTEAAPWVIEEVKRLEAENARLKEALAWYGQEWLYDIKEFVCAATLSIAGELPKQETIQGNPIQHDRGKRARAALEGK